MPTGAGSIRNYATRLLGFGYVRLCLTRQLVVVIPNQSLQQVKQLQNGGHQVEDQRHQDADHGTDGNRRIRAAHDARLQAQQVAQRFSELAVTRQQQPC